MIILMIIVSLSNYNLYITLQVASFPSSFSLQRTAISVICLLYRDRCHSPKKAPAFPREASAGLRAQKKNIFFHNKTLYNDNLYIMKTWWLNAWIFRLFFSSKKSWESIRSIFAWVCFFRRPASTLKQKGCFRFSNLSPVPLEVQHFEASLILLSETSRSWKKISFALPKIQISFNHLTQTFLPSVYVLES